jgi:hypothetical protein
VLGELILAQFHQRTDHSDVGNFQLDTALLRIAVSAASAELSHVSTIVPRDDWCDSDKVF